MLATCFVQGFGACAHNQVQSHLIDINIIYSVLINPYVFHVGYSIQDVTSCSRQMDEKSVDKGKYTGAVFLDLA